MTSRVNKQKNRWEPRHDKLIESISTLSSSIKEKENDSATALIKQLRESFSEDITTEDDASNAINALITRIENIAGVQQKITGDMVILLEQLKQFYKAVYGLLAFGYLDIDIEDDKKGLVEVEELGLEFKSPDQLKTFFEKPRLYPPDFVFNQLLRQTSIDYLRIKSATDRVNNQTMRLAEFVARRAVDPCEACGLMGYTLGNKSGDNNNDETVIVTYPTSRVEIRLLPYTNAFFIGFPVSATGTLGENPLLSTSFLALAHETGHMLFRSGRTAAYGDDNPSPSLLSRVLERRLYQTLVNNGMATHEFNWIFKWLEEIFADVYGFIVEGPVMLVGFQEMMISDHPTEELGHSHDHVHPTPALRPIIQSQMMNMLAERIHQFVGFEYPSELQSDKDREQWRKKRVGKINEITAALNKEWALDTAATWQDWVNRAWPFGFEDEFEGKNGSNRIDILSRIEKMDETGMGVSEKLLTHATYEVHGRALTGRAIMKITKIAICLIIELLIERGLPADKIKWFDLDISFDDELSIKDQLILKFAESVKQDMVLEPKASNEDSKNVSADSGYSFTPKGPLAQIITDLKNTDASLTHVDQLVDLLIFNGWSDEGPKGSGFGGG